MMVHQLLSSSLSSPDAGTADATTNMTAMGCQQTPEEFRRFAFSSASTWFEAGRSARTSRKLYRRRIVSLHEKDPSKIRFLNQAVANLTRSNQTVTFASLQPFLDRYNESMS